MADTSSAGSPSKRTGAAFTLEEQRDRQVSFFGGASLVVLVSALSDVSSFTLAVPGSRNTAMNPDASIGTKHETGISQLARRRVSAVH